MIFAVFDLFPYFIWILTIRETISRHICWWCRHKLSKVKIVNKSRKIVSHHILPFHQYHRVLVLKSLRFYCSKSYLATCNPGDNCYHQNKNYFPWRNNRKNFFANKWGEQYLLFLRGIDILHVLISLGRLAMQVLSL